jgi:hypothetical protein
MVPRDVTFGYENIRAEGQSRMHAGNVYNNNTTNHSKALNICRSYVHEHSELIVLA